jgi:hypothetical protein
MSERSAPDGTATMQGAGPAGARALAAVAGHAARLPEEPALFHPDGLDVRWRSWRGLADQVAGGVAALRRVLEGAGSGADEGGPAVALSWRCHPDAVAAWLAIHGAGARPVPVISPAEAVDAVCAAWLLQPEERPPVFEGAGGGREAPVEVVSLPPAAVPGERRRGTPAPLPPWSDGSGESGPKAGPEPGSLAARIECAAASSEAAGRAQRPGAREIVLAHLDLNRDLQDGSRRSGDEALLSWALITGAALLLEPDPRAVAGSAAWARPTLVAAGAQPLAELVRWLRGREGRPGPRWLASLRRSRTRRPFGRLRLLVVLGPGRLPVDDVPFWADRGVAVLRAEPPEAA